MKNKKAVEIRFLTILLVGAFIFLVLVFILPKLIGKAGNELSFGLSETEDNDGDSLADYYDKCKCQAADTDSGCPKEVNPNEAKFCQYQDCCEDKVPSWAKTNCEGKTVSC